MRQNLLIGIVTVVVLSSVTVSAVPFTFHIPYRDTCTIFNEQNLSMVRISSGWPQIFDGGAEDGSMGGLVIDSQGNVIVTGYSWDIVTNESNILTLKYDSDGNELWQTTFDSSVFELPWDIAVDTQDNVIVMGLNATSMTDFEELKIDFRIIKYDRDGVEQWNTSHRKALNGFPGGVAADSNNNIIFTTAVGNFDALDYAGWTLKLNEQGDELWNTTFRDDMVNFLADVTVDSNDNIIVGGVFASFIGQGYCCVKYDGDGNKQWVKRYAGGNQPRAIAIDANDNIILTGTNYSTITESSSWYTLKCDHTGELLWKQEYDSGSHDYPGGLAVNSHGHIITVGASSFSQENHSEHCVIIYDTDGEELCMKRPGMNGTIYGVAIDHSDTIFITADLVGVSSWDYYTTKYIDVVPPSVYQEAPVEKSLYLFNKKILSLPKNTIIFGDITVKLEVDDPSDVTKVEFYLDHQLIETLGQHPYEWTWDTTTFAKHTITTLAYDDMGNIARNEIMVWRFF